VPPSHLLYFFAITVCVISVTKFGGREEWTALAGVVGASILTPFLQRQEFATTEYGIMAVDMALLAWLAAISLGSNRIWPLFAAGFHLAGTVVHFVPMSGASMSKLAYSYASAGSAYFVLLAITVGALFEVRHLPDAD
jgi:hypothetical protein